MSKIESSTPRASGLEPAAPKFDFDVTLLKEPLPDLAVRWGGFQRLVPSESCYEHVNYRFGFIILVLTGFGTFRCKDQSWKLEPGVVFWSRPGLTTRFELAPDSPPIEHYVVMPFGLEIGNYFERYLGSDVGAAPVIDLPSTKRLFEVLMDEGQGGSNYREQNFVDLLKSLIRRLHSQIVIGRSLGSNARETYLRARQYIQGHYSEIRELVDIAREVDVTIPYLCRLFERHGSTTPFEYLTCLKMNKAERLLCTTSLPIREIGAAVGFSDLQLFSRNFKNRYGLSPSYYRKARREEHDAS